MKAIRPFSKLPVTDIVYFNTEPKTVCKVKRVTFSGEHTEKYHPILQLHRGF